MSVKSLPLLRLRSRREQALEPKQGVFHPEHELLALVELTPSSRRREQAQAHPLAARSQLGRRVHLESSDGGPAYGGQANDGAAGGFHAEVFGPTIRARVEQSHRGLRFSIRALEVADLWRLQERQESAQFIASSPPL